MQGSYVTHIEAIYLALVERDSQCYVREEEQDGLFTTTEAKKNQIKYKQKSTYSDIRRRHEERIHLMLSQLFCMWFANVPGISRYTMLFLASVLPCTLSSLGYICKMVPSAYCCFFT